MKNKDFTVIPFNSARLKDKYLITNALGSWDMLDDDEFRRLGSFRIDKDSPLFERLHDRGLVADERNIRRLIKEYRQLNANLFCDTSLHIAVVTLRCNLGCSYCQTSSSEGGDMNHETASRVLKYLFDVNNKSVALELQGGEPLLNWEVCSFLIDHARKFNTIGKDLKIALVSNLTLMDEEKMKFLVEKDVEICTSLDGPRQIHDASRVMHGGRGTYDIVCANIKKLKDKFGKRVNLLPTLTRRSLPRIKDIIDEYVCQGQDEIALRPVNKIGIACANWLDLGYTAEDFCRAYRIAMDYILKLNKNGGNIRERTARVILEKILNKKDPMYVELMNPCGAGRSTIVYMPDGSCYPCDESRMVGEDMFKLGSIMEENYEDMMKKDTLLHLLEASLINLWDYRSVFSPWMSNCPVVNYALQKNIVPKINCSPLNKVMRYQFTYIFEKIAEDGNNLEIFKSWISDNPKEAR